MRPAHAGTLRRSLVCGRDICESRRAVGLLVPGDRPGRPGHRCAGLPEAGSGGHPPVLYLCLVHGPCPTEVTADRTPAYLRVIEELIPAACHVTEQYTNNVVEA